MSSATFYTGDVLQVLAKLPDQSVDLVITSPPFLALRSYLPADHPDKTLEGGSQSTPGEFVDWLLDVVEACDRVLAPHGSMCFELGDTFAGSGGGGGDYYEDGLRAGQPGFTGSAGASRDEIKAANAAHWRQKNPPKRSGGAGGDYSEDGLREGQPKFKAQRMASGASDDPAAERAAGVHRIQRDGHRASIRNMDYKTQGSGNGWPADKSLALIPETFRFALAYGFNPHTGRTTTPWRIRNVIRWVRPNPPVGALGDKFRPATSEMVVFCRTDEAGRRRYFDLDAVREPYRGNHKMGEPVGGRGKDYADDVRSGWVNRKEVLREDRGGAPPLDWWNIPTHPYKGAHYATFPPELCVKPIKAMSPERVCRTCGEPSRRVVGEAEYVKPDGTRHKSLDMREGTRAAPGVNQWVVKGSDTGNFSRVAPTLGWTDCNHDDWRPGVVLDPFAGSGTTLSVAVGHGRNAIGIDLDERNVELARERVGPMFFEEGVL